MKPARDFSFLSELASAPGETILTPAEVAALSGFKEVTLRLWAREGRGPRRTVIEGRPRYMLRHVREWLGAHEAAA